MNFERKELWPIIGNTRIETKYSKNCKPRFSMSPARPEFAQGKPPFSPLPFENSKDEGKTSHSHSLTHSHTRNGKYRKGLHFLL
jgi:hypothetical protein